MSKICILIAVMLFNNICMASDFFDWTAKKNEADGRVEISSDRFIYTNNDGLTTMGAVSVVTIIIGLLKKEQIQQWTEEEDMTGVRSESLKSVIKDIMFLKGLDLNNIQLQDEIYRQLQEKINS
jgi:hypothetical protein